MALAILFSCPLALLGAEAWMNQAEGYVRWSKPSTIVLDGLTVYSTDHSEENLARAGYTYISNAPDCNLEDMVIDYAAGTIRAKTAEELQAEYDAQFIQKDSFIVETEKAYTNLLTQVGLSGAWANHDYTYQQVGLYFMANNLVVEMLLADKLYGILSDYYRAYGGTDLRDYPWGLEHIVEPAGQ